jgi:hypothetical protein
VLGTPGQSGRRRAWYLLLVAVIPLAAWAATGVSRDRPHGGVRAATGPAPAEPPPTTAEPAPSPPPGTCDDALTWAASVGLPLPAGTGYRCPSTEFAHHGATCWYATPCRNGRFIAINTELMGPVSQDYFRFVVAHEICHVLQFDATGDSTEAQADACAIAHGARR